MAMFPYVPHSNHSTESPRCCYYAAQRSLAAPGPGYPGSPVDAANSVVIGESLRTRPSYCELLRQDMSTCFLVIVVWCCFPCSWTKFNVGLGVWLMSAGKPIGTRSAGRWVVGWVKPSSAGICFGNSCYLELDSIHEAILCFMPSLSTNLIQVMYTLYWVCQCPHVALLPWQLGYTTVPKWFARQLEAMCFKCRLFRYHLVSKWAFQSLGSRMNVYECVMCVCVHLRAQMSIIVQCCCLHAMRPDDVYCIPMHIYAY